MNSSRFPAMQAALDHLAVQLQVECDVPGVVGALWRGELSMELEHCERRRLMSQTKPFESRRITRGKP